MPAACAAASPVGDLHGQVEQLARALGWRDGRALDQFHDEVIWPDVVKLADIGMIERGHGARLALEALAELGLRDFDCDGAVEPDVASFVDLTHAAGAYRREDFVRS